MSSGGATDMVLGEFRGAEMASSWDQSRLLGGSDVCAAAGQRQEGRGGYGKAS